jgi:hypothetical protein
VERVSGGSRKSKSPFPQNEKSTKKFLSLDLDAIVNLWNYPEPLLIVFAMWLWQRLHNKQRKETEMCYQNKEYFNFYKVVGNKL